MMHAKTAVVDGIWATVGSCNLDVLSMRYNLESNVVVLGDHLATPLREQFLADTQASRAVEIRWDTWKTRSKVQRFLDSLAYRFRNWM